jgi:hypothetical protein
MRSAVAGVTARPDLAEVELGAGRVRTRRRVATGVVAAMLVAGAGGTGFGIGRAVSGGDDGAISAAADDDTDGTDATDSTAAPSDDPTVPIAPPRATVLPSEEAVADAVDERFSDGALSSYYEPQPMELIYERVLIDGVRVRALRGQSYGDDFGYPGGQWQPAAFCWGTGELRVTVDGLDVVDVSGTTFYEELFDGVELQPLGLGWADDRDMRVLVVQADAGYTEATVRWADGLTDTAPIIDGMALLVVDGSSPWEVEYEADLVGADGTRTITQADMGHWNDPEWRAACQEPPPALPDAGEQPDDPDAERTAIEERFALLWNTDIDRSATDDLLDDWTGVAEAIDGATTGDYADVVGSAVHTIDELVFTSPTEAWFRYSIVTDLTSFYDRYGTVALVDGVWQFPRAVICQDLGLTGGGCDPWVDNIYPPSWYERYDAREECWETEAGEVVCEAVDEGYLVPTSEPPGPPPLLVAPATTTPAG